MPEQWLIGQGGGNGTQTASSATRTVHFTSDEVCINKSYEVVDTHSDNAVVNPIHTSEESPSTDQSYLSSPGNNIRRLIQMSKEVDYSQLEKLFIGKEDVPITFKTVSSEDRDTVIRSLPSELRKMFTRVIDVSKEESIHFNQFPFSVSEITPMEHIYILVSI
jgi:hypothetical protein